LSDKDSLILVQNAQRFPARRTNESHTQYILLILLFNVANWYFLIYNRKEILNS